MTGQRALRFLAHWLLDPCREAPPPEVLRAAGLGAYAYTALSPEHPGRAALRSDYLAALSRHQRIKAELLPLLRAWNEAGIEPLLFKGFHLAEWVYPVPGARFHGDVDVLVAPGQVQAASAVAQRLGWAEEHNTAEAGQPYFHNAYALHGPGGAASVDVHRWVLHAPLPWNRVQRRVTAQVWSASRARVWEGVRIRELVPVDALVVGLILQRCWGGDRWHLKPHDALDFRFIVQRLGVTREELRGRARELRAECTLALFLERCDPEAMRLDLAPPSAAALRRWDLGAFRERGPLGSGERALLLLYRAPHLVRDLPAGASVLLRVRRTLRRGTELRDLLRSLTPSVPAQTSAVLSTARRGRIVRQIRWASRLFPRNPRGDCLLRSLAVYTALRGEGWPVRFVSGIRRDAAGVTGHAWVELDGKVLPELNEPGNRSAYTPNFEYPPPASHREGAAPAGAARVG